MSWTVTLEAKPTAKTRSAIRKVLVAHNKTAMGRGSYAHFAITVRDEAGVIAGGLWGHVWHGFLYVELLAMGNAKGEGVGRKVMALAEAEALRRGCAGIWLDTFTWQAPWFYPKLGFEEFGRIRDFPSGQDRIFLVKRLAPTRG